jgi:hypothetical protein
MIQFTIEVPIEAMMSMTPKMILGNYITNDSRLRKVECDRLMNLCDVEIEPKLDPIREISCYIIRAIYKDPEAEMITRLTL